MAEIMHALRAIPSITTQQGGGGGGEGGIHYMEWP